MSSLFVPLNPFSNAPGLTTSGTSLGYNYEGNSEVNTIEAGANSHANTCFGGYTGQPNQIQGLSAYRTISGGYDNIIGRPNASYPLDNAIATTIAGGAHQRIRRPLNTSDKDTNPVAIPTESPSGNYPNHAFIGGGGYHYIHNGVDSLIVGGFGNAIFASVIVGGTNEVSYTGSKAAIVGGYGNAVGASYGFIGGGETNKVLAHHAAIVGGVNNTISKGSATGSGASAGYTAEGYSFIGGGSTNTVNKSQFAMIAGGELNTIGSTASDIGSYCSILGGLSNEAGTTAYAWGATVLGGWNNHAQGLWSLASGRHANATNAFQHAHAHEQFAVRGDCQTSVFVLKAQTTDATATTMTANAAAISLPTGGTWSFRALVSARQNGSTNAAAWIIQGAATNAGGATTVMGTPTVTALGNSGSPTWSVAVDAAGANIRIRVTGAAGTTVRWSARMDTAEVI